MSDALLSIILNPDLAKALAGALFGALAVLLAPYLQLVVSKVQGFVLARATLPLLETHLVALEPKLKEVVASEVERLVAEVSTRAPGAAPAARAVAEWGEDEVAALIDRMNAYIRAKAAAEAQMNAYRT